MRSSLDPRRITHSAHLVLPHLPRIAVSACLHRPPPHLAWPLHVPFEICLCLSLSVLPSGSTLFDDVHPAHSTVLGHTRSSPYICLINEPMEGVARSISHAPSLWSQNSRHVACLLCPFLLRKTSLTTASF